jgi:hypothetical protein
MMQPYPRDGPNGGVNSMTMEVTMERNTDRGQELVDLGAASIETRGDQGGLIDSVQGQPALGLSDGED